MQARSHSQTEATFARALLDPLAPLPAGVTNRHGLGDALRFAVYRNNVAFSLTRALAQRFPVIEALLGADCFGAVARDFMAEHRPVSPLLFAYGEQFPGFLECHAALSALPYLGDVARIEAASTRAYHAADRAVMTLGELAAIDPDRLGAMRPAIHPAAGLIISRFPAGRIWQAHQPGAEASGPLSGPDTVLVTRPDLAVQVHILPGQSLAFAKALFDGAPLGEAAQVGADAHRDFDFGQSLVGLLGAGLFTSSSEEIFP